jgi:hypothetical protein
LYGPKLLKTTGNNALFGWSGLINVVQLGT